MAKYKGHPGEDHPGAKLTDDDIREIRRLRSENVKQKVICEMFHISQSNLSSIVRRKTWKHVE